MNKFTIDRLDYDRVLVQHNDGEIRLFKRGEDHFYYWKVMSLTNRSRTFEPNDKSLAMNMWKQDAPTILE